MGSTVSTQDLRKNKIKFTNYFEKLNIFEIFRGEEFLNTWDYYQIVMCTKVKETKDKRKKERELGKELEKQLEKQQEKNLEKETEISKEKTTFDHGNGELGFDFREEV